MLYATQKYAEIAKSLEELKCLLANYRDALKQTAGTHRTVVYENIMFNIRRDLVDADLTPLAFVGLVEPITAEGEGPAIDRLQDRIMPLLSGTHYWIAPKWHLN